MALSLIPCLQAGAVTVTYAAVDLADAVSGQDLWRYDYSIEGAFDAFDTLSLEYADDSYGQLALTVFPGVLLTTVPPIFVGLPGTPSLLALTAPAAAAASSDTLSVSFVWLGSGLPGSQPFGIASDATGSIVQSGFTAPAAVPEPAAGLLMLAGLAGLALRARSRPLPAVSPRAKR